jgi:hypothetical protein
MPSPGIQALVVLPVADDFWCRSSKPTKCVATISTPRQNSDLAAYCKAGSRNHRRYRAFTGGMASSNGTSNAHAMPMERGRCARGCGGNFSSA